MTNRTIQLDEALYAYVTDMSLREPALLRRLRAETADLPESNMQIAPEQGQFMALLATLMGASRAIELGVYTGYSALCLAGALPAHGRLVACDLSTEWTAMARRYWTEAGLAGRIDLRIGPALETLDGLLAAGEAGTFDLAFVDADKEEYADYYERLLGLLRPGGLIMVDNVLWDGSVIDPARDDGDTVAIRAFNEMVRDDPRVDISLVPIGDGLTLARKRP